METIVPLNTDIYPRASVSRAVVLATEIDTILTFDAQRRRAGGRYEEAGTAVVRFDGCSVYTFGYPNDEAWVGIPRTRGLTYACYEVLNSEWNAKLAELNRHSFPDSRQPDSRHFLFLFHDSSFECLARGCTIEAVSFDRANAISLAFLKASETS
jgi:hypothetical protein